MAGHWKGEYKLLKLLYWIKAMLIQVYDEINEREAKFMEAVHDCVRRDDLRGMLGVMLKPSLSDLAFMARILFVPVTVLILIRYFWPWSILFPVGIALALFKGNAILAWLHKKALAWWQERKRPCNHCPGCADFYEPLLRITYEAVIQCADYLALKVPHTRGMMEVPHGENLKDDIPRFYFKVQRDTRVAEPVSLSVVQACLQDAVSDAFRNVYGNTGYYIWDVYVEKVETLNLYSILVCLVPWCAATDEYIQKRCQLKIQSQDAPEAEQSREVLDDEF